MPTTDPRIDAYIEHAAPFAQPILTQLRSAVHIGCPAVVETIKWSMPFYMHGDRILANMAAFKQHCSFRFWNGREAAERGQSDEAMGQFGRLATLRDLPPKRELVTVVKRAVALIDAGGTSTRAATPRGAAAQPDMPVELAQALARRPPPAARRRVSAARATRPRRARPRRHRRTA